MQNLTICLLNVVLSTFNLYISSATAIAVNNFSTSIIYAHSCILNFQILHAQILFINICLLTILSIC